MPHTRRQRCLRKHCGTQCRQRPYVRQQQDQGLQPPCPHRQANEGNQRSPLQGPSLCHPGDRTHVLWKVDYVLKVVIPDLLPTLLFNFPSDLSSNVALDLTRLSTTYRFLFVSVNVLTTMRRSTSVPRSGRCRSRRRRYRLMRRPTISDATHSGLLKILQRHFLSNLNVGSTAQPFLCSSAIVRVRSHAIKTDRHCGYLVIDMRRRER